MEPLRDHRHLKDPAVQEIIRGMDVRGTLSTMTPAEKRDAARTGVARGGPPEPVETISDLTVEGRSGPIPIRVYRPAGITLGSAPIGIYLHGGGFISGDLETHDTLCRTLANTAQAVIVAVGYRLAPEFRYPAALEDCSDVLLWVEANAAHLGGDERRMAVLGDSAGGNLAAVLARKATEESGIRLAGQVLIYPALDASMRSESLVSNALVPPFTLLDCLYMWQQYLPEGVSREHPDISPSCASEIPDLPPALIITAEFDILCGEGAAYAERLRSGGVPVQHVHVPGMPHGFLLWGGTVEAARNAVASIGHFLRSM